MNQKTRSPSSIDYKATIHLGTAKEKEILMQNQPHLIPGFYASHKGMAWGLLWAEVSVSSSAHISS